MLPAPDRFQKFAMSLMLVLVVISFTFTNTYALLWTSSEWLVSTILPAVIVDLTNDERQQQSLQSLRHNPVLDAAATRKAEHMAENEYFAHFSPDNVSPWHWFQQVGYQYVHAGENLAIHFSDSDEVVQAWMNSPTHRANIVNGQFAEIGVGTARGSYQGFPTTYVVQLFGTPLAQPERSYPATVVTETEPAADAATSSTELASETSDTAPTPPTAVLAAENPSSSVSTTPASSSEEPSDTVDLPPAVADTEALTATDSDTSAPATTSQSENAAPTTATTTVPTTTLTMTETDAGEVFFTSSTLTTTTSGTPAFISYTHTNQAPASWHLLTQPERFLQLLYMGIAGMVFALLLIALVGEARRQHPMQMAYSVGLLVLMVVLWSLQSSLSSGALVV